MKKTNEKGITLIALVITIIIMIILVEVTVAFALSDKGVVNNSKEAAEKTKIQGDKEDLYNYIWGKDIYNVVTGKLNLGLLKTTLGDSWNSQVNDNNTELKVYGTRSGKEFVITNEGKIIENEDPINQPGGGNPINQPWVQQGAENTDITFANGTTTTVKLGDIVNYQADGYSGQWKVLGVENGQLLLVSAENVTEISFWDLIGGDDKRDINALNNLNNACSVYLNSNYATNARSITAEDINKITGYDPAGFPGYGDRIKYRKIDGVLKYIMNDGAEQSIETSEEFYNWDNIPLGEEWSDEFENTRYEYNINSYNSKLGDILSSSMFMLASPTVAVSTTLDYVEIGLRLIRNGNMQYGDMWNTAWHSPSIEDTVGVRAVVSLKPEINLTSNGTNSWNLGT